MKLNSKLATIALLTLSFNIALADKTAGESVDDAWLHTKVKTALVGHGTSNINIEVYHGVVQLAGFVEDEVHHKAALDAAAGVQGVERVSDRLILAEPGRTAGRTLDDNVLTGSVKSAIADADIGQGLNVNVEVNRGRVLLTGFVDSVEVRTNVVDIVEGVDGVEEVINGMDLKT